MTPNKAATLIADKYVGRNGQAIDLETSHHQRLEDITAVASFLVWLPKGAMWGGVRAKTRRRSEPRSIYAPRPPSSQG